MNKQEAILAMLDGNRVTHQTFTSDEYIYMKDGKIYDEEDFLLYQFWELRTDDCWDNYWSIFGIINSKQIFPLINPYSAQELFRRPLTRRERRKIEREKKMARKRQTK